MTQNAGFDPENKVKVCFDFKMLDVNNWVLVLTEKMVPRGSPSQRPFQCYLRDLEIVSVLDNVLPWSEVISTRLNWWQSPFNILKCSDLLPKDHNVLIFTDTSNVGWGVHLVQDSAKDLWKNGYTQRKMATHQYTRAKGSRFGPETFQDSMLK